MHGKDAERKAATGVLGVKLVKSKARKGSSKFTPAVAESSQDSLFSYGGTSGMGFSW